MKSHAEILKQLQISEPFPTSHMCKVIFLRDFIYAHRNLPEQGTPEWLEVRRNTIGGSEISTVLGYGMGTLKELALQKAGLRVFAGNFYTEWGKMFEPAVQLYLETLLNCTIYETGSLPGCTHTTSYSPDGFAVIKTESIQSAVDAGLIDQHTIPHDPIVLFEIKSPATRQNPTRSIPDYYINQPLSGLMHFPFVDIAYYVEVVFRITTKAALDAHLAGAALVYNMNIHESDVKRSVYTKMVDYGYIAFQDTLKDAEHYTTKVEFAELFRYKKRYGIGEYTEQPGDTLVVWFAMCDVIIKPLYRDPEVFNEVNVFLCDKFMANLRKAMAADDVDKKISSIWV